MSEWWILLYVIIGAGISYAGILVGITIGRGLR